MSEPLCTNSPAATTLAEALHDLGFSPDWRELVSMSGAGDLPSCFAVSDLAVAPIGAAGVALADLLAAAGRPVARVTVARHIASAWFRYSLLPVGWSVPDAWDPIAGDYRAIDCWIRLHTNAPHYRKAALEIIGCVGERDAVAAAVGGWPAEALEAAIIQAGGCAAKMRSRGDWRVHAQGQAVAKEPLIELARAGQVSGEAWHPEPTRPLRGIRVLDLTRVLAGPVATRFLAGLGADVLRIDPPDWDEPGLVPDVTLGKRCARLDLRKGDDRRRLETLLAGADILVHGYRPGALERLGLGEDERRRINPGLIDVSLCAWGWSGPWCGRRGFDSLVQMACGIAAAGMDWKTAERPVPLPVQALDQATGYFMAAAALRGLALRLREQRGVRARLSLARTAMALGAPREGEGGEPLPALAAEDFGEALEQTPWGAARRLRSPLAVGEVVLYWDRSANQLGSAEAQWIAK